MGIRLNKASNQLNVGVLTLIEFLESHHIGEIKADVNPNTKITDEQYQALEKMFRTDGRVKANAEVLATKIFKNKPEERNQNAKKKKKKKRSSNSIQVSEEIKQKWAEQRQRKRSREPNNSATKEKTSNSSQRKNVRSLKEINRLMDIDEALWCFTWPTLAYNQSDDWYVQDLIGHNEEMMTYYHNKMKGYFGLDHVLKKEYSKMIDIAKKKDIINVSLKDIYIPEKTNNDTGFSEVWIPQPMATLLAAGLTKILKWPNLAEYKYSEKVLVYALKSTRRTRRFIKDDVTLYSSYYNALHMGNKLGSNLPEHVYIGYIVIGNKTIDGNYEILESTEFATISSIKPTFLKNLGVSKNRYNKITLENRTLKIPVFDEDWPVLDNNNSGAFYYYWMENFNQFYSEDFGCGDGEGLYEILLFNDKQEKIYAQEDKKAITKKTRTNNTDENDYDVLVVNFDYLREKSKHEESSFNILKRKEWILDWNCVKFKNGYFVVLPPENGNVKFKPKAFPYRTVGESFNYLKEYLNDRLKPIRCYVEALSLTIYDQIRLEEAIEKFAVVSKQRAITSNASKQPPKEQLEQMSFNQALSKAAKMTPEEFEKYKSDYINFLVKIQSKDYKVIPCVERLAHTNSDITEYAFLFSIRCSSGRILIVHENVNPDRSTLLFLVEEESFNRSIREIYDFLQSAEINKRSSLREKNIYIEDAKILNYRSINHDDLYSWKQTINTYKHYR